MRKPAASSKAFSLNSRRLAYFPALAIGMEPSLALSRRPWSQSLRPARSALAPASLAALSLLAALPAAASDYPILPGYWESRNKVTSVVTLSNKVERKCVTPKDVEKFMSGPSNRHYTCTYPSRRFEGGKVAMAGQCVDKKGRKIGVTVSGTYTPTSYEMTAHLNTRMAGLPLSGNATSEAQRIGDTCPAGSEIK